MIGIPMTVTETAPQELTVNFAESLSAYASLPSFEIWNGIQAIPLAEEVEWSDSRDIVIIQTTSVDGPGVWKTKFECLTYICREQYPALQA